MPYGSSSILSEIQGYVYLPVSVDDGVTCFYLDMDVAVTPPSNPNTMVPVYG